MTPNVLVPSKPAPRTRSQIAHALIPVLETSLPVKKEAAQAALGELGELCGWKDDFSQDISTINDFLIDEIRRIDDEQLSDAALVLFGACKELDTNLTIRRQAAAELLAVSHKDFRLTKEPRILGLLAWNVKQRLWGPDINRYSKFWRRCILPLAAIISACCFGFSFLEFDASIYHDTFWLWLWLARLALAGFAISLAWVCVNRLQGQPLKKSSRQRRFEVDVDYLPIGRADSLRQRAGKDLPLTELEAEVFALAITSPTQLRSRIFEQYEPEQRVLRQNVSMDIQIPHEYLEGITGDLRIPFPILVLPKGELTDNFRIRDASGNLMAAFSHREYLALVSGVLRMLLIKAYTVPKQRNGTDKNKEAQQAANRSFEPADLPEKAIEAERAAVRCIMQRGVHKPRRKAHSGIILLEGSVESAVDGILNLRREATGTAEEKPDYISLKLAAELVRKLSNHYAIVADANCPANGHMVLSYERLMIPELGIAGFKRSQRLGWLKDRISLGLGARPVNLSLDLDNAPTCQSYHITALCPEGLYLRKQELIGLDDYFNKYDRRKAFVPPYYRVRQRLGQPHAHFYTRFFPSPKVQKDGTIEELPKLELSFYEVPPGSYFRAFVVSLSCFLLVWAVGFVLARGRGDDAGTDAPTILLAFPAVVAAWLGFEAPSRRLLEGTLAARLSLVFSAGLAIFASVLSMMYRANVPFLQGTFHPFPINLTFLGIKETSWAWLVASALVNTLISGHIWLKRTSEYKYLSSRSVTKAQEILRVHWGKEVTDGTPASRVRQEVSTPS